jgi:hypothetical protein
MVHYNNLHPGQARSMVQFANGLDIGATIYVGGTLGGAVLTEGGLGELGVASYNAITSNPATASAVLYGVTIFNNSVHPDHQLILPEIIEFEIKLEQIYPWILRH